MNKIIATSLLVLASGLSLSTTALAEPFNHSSSYTNAISNTESNQNISSAPSVRYTDTAGTTIGFNDRETAASGTMNSRVPQISLSQMLSSIMSGFNDRS